jgi:hypothetical protein
LLYDPFQGSRIRPLLHHKVKNPLPVGHVFLMALIQPG